MSRAAGRALWLVRHAMPALQPEVDPALWVLSDAGLAAAAELRERLPADALLVASDEPKAWQTVDPSGSTVLRDPRLGEVRREEPFGDGFRERRLAYVTGTDHEGWEPRADVAARFGEAVSEHLAAAGARPLVVASHGMAMTLWLTSLGSVTDPGTFWSELAFPDLVEVRLP